MRFATLNTPAGPIPMAGQVVAWADGSATRVPVRFEVERISAETAAAAVELGRLAGHPDPETLRQIEGEILPAEAEKGEWVRRRVAELWPTAPAQQERPRLEVTADVIDAYFAWRGFDADYEPAWWLVVASVHGEPLPAGQEPGPYFVARANAAIALYRAAARREATR